MQQRLSIASIRRAAHAVAQTGVVTDIRIAGELKIDVSVVKHFLDGIQNLRTELSVTSAVRCPDKYERVILLLQDRGILVSCRRIALLTNSSEVAVRAWYRHRPAQAHLLSTRAEMKLYARMQRARWHVAACSKSTASVNYSMLSRKVGMNRSLFMRTLRRWPSLRRDLESRK